MDMLLLLHTVFFVHAVAFGRDFDDSYSAADVHIVTFNKVPSDSAGFTDSNVVDLTKVRNEQLNLSDAQQFDIDKALSDTIFATDDSNGAAVGDDQRASVFKNRTEIVVVAESHITEFGKVPSDSSGFTDSGVILNQDYCDISYFSDDYVGVKRQF